MNNLCNLLVKANGNRGFDEFAGLHFDMKIFWLSLDKGLRLYVLCLFYVQSFNQGIRIGQTAKLTSAILVVA